MNEIHFTKASAAIGQLNLYLLGDRECVDLLRKINRRLGLLAHGGFGAPVEQSLTLEALPVEQLREALSGFILAAIKEHDERIEQRITLRQLLDTWAAYVKALEERCSALAGELKKAGLDESKYPEIPKP
jgi:hypothetical protein